MTGDPSQKLGPTRFWHFHIPYLRLTGTKNGREHHFTRARRVAAERSATTALAKTKLGPHWAREIVFPIEVKIIRYGPRLLDDDNEKTACSGVRDAIATMIAEVYPGFSDKKTDTRASWPTAQRKGEWGVEVEIRVVGSGGEAA